MAVIAKDNGGGEDFLPCPDGMHPAICVDVIDLGEEETPFLDPRTGQKKKAPKIKIVWQLHPLDEHGNVVLRVDGKPFRVNQFYTLSLGSKANLRKDLEAWRGKPFTDDDLKNGFDVEVLIGVQCQLGILNKPGKKDPTKTYANVVSIAPKHRADPKIVIDPDFKRELEIPGGKDMRSPRADGGSRPALPDPFEDDDEDLPF